MLVSSFSCAYLLSIYLFGKVCANILPIKKLNHLYYYWVIFLKCTYILHWSNLSDIYFADTFSPSVICLFILLIVFFIWCWERLGAGGEGDNRGWDGWMASPTQWTWVWVNSGSWWWTERPGVLRFMGSQRVGHDWATEGNWTELNLIWFQCNQNQDPSMENRN